MATRVGLIQIFGASVVLTVLFYWFCHVFMLFDCIFCISKFSALKNCVFCEFRFIPEFCDSFCFSYRGKLETLL